MRKCCEFFSLLLLIRNSEFLWCFLAAYIHKYIIEPGETIRIEAASDPIGLKFAIIYDAAPEGQVLYYHRFQAKNGSTFTITHIDGADISTFGGIFDIQITFSIKLHLLVCASHANKIFILFRQCKSNWQRTNKRKRCHKICGIN